MKFNPENPTTPEFPEQPLKHLEAPGNLDARVKKEGPKNLEEQFAHPERIRIGEEEVDVYDISPEERKTEIPTVLAPGFSATPMAHEQNILGLAEAGRRVISVDSPHGLAEHGIKENLASKHAEVELAKLSAIIKALDERGVEQADVVAHSEGGIYMALAASLYPGRFRNMVFVEPGGMIGKDNVFRLGKSMAHELAGQTVNEARRTDSDRYAEKLRSPLIPLRVIASNLKRAWGSVKAIADSDIIDILKDLKVQGVGISIIHGVDDKVFPMERVQKEVSADAITGFYSVRGGHNEIFTRPKQYTKAVDLALDALEAKSNKQSVKTTS
ncbi:MAG: alpha/beta hydrolase [Patescibacteria group bacterium]